MLGDYQICPYTGLRSFTEEESIYFKGRETDIDLATAQLQKNKYLMVTGASGDGKSSLVYAGMIPNARAGFLKSKYTNWCVAGFRPERTPFDNLCEAVALQLDIANADTVKAELSHGFSALVDLYRNSKRYVDTESPGWLDSNEAARAKMRREGANLIVLVDQFEEFFTNPENYQKGSPSKDAALVVNLLLETARIALEEDLPVYVVFTMRSDYVGQCADFRGLPEYIGFSQFFVPRLNRSQLQQVIEEPALLSGNKITRRLTERLIHDLTEGVDQLPILQHALNQIWVAAENGTQEMDLIHYAMVGGLNKAELTDEQSVVFEKWFQSLPPQIQSCYHTPGLQNVLDTHTNKLYEQAAGYFKEKSGEFISDEDAKQVIRTTFTCLTKIDKGRAVRNRMTLQEITQIFGRPGFDAEKMGQLLNIFREPGNTFIHPFIYDEYPESRHLLPVQVLDITHESLIRNWQWLGQWAKEEHESHQVSLDFEKQLDRWVESGKSDNFLLSIGPLTYFENWYNKAKPNAWHIARYLPQEVEGATRIARAKMFLADSQEFIRRSASKHVITRTLMRYGARRIAIVAGIILLITLSSFGIRDYFRKQNDAVLKSLDQAAATLVQSPRVNTIGKVCVLEEQLKLGRTTVRQAVNLMEKPVQKASLAHFIASGVVFQGYAEPQSIVKEGLHLADSILNTIPVPENDPKALSDLLLVGIDMRATLELNFVYQGDSVTADLIKKNAQRTAAWALNILTTQPAGMSDIDIANFELAMENGIAYNAFTKAQLQQILAILSPFENNTPSNWVQQHFKRELLMPRGELGYGFFFNGLYQDLAYLYAATGNTPKVMQCIDTLFTYSQANFQGDYAAGIDNATNIASVYFTNGNTSQLDDFVNGYSSRKKITAVEFYKRLLGRMLRERATLSNFDLLWWQGAKSNINLRFAKINQVGFFYDKLREAITTSAGNADEKNFLVALAYKDEGIQKSATREKDPDHSTDFYFDQSLKFYALVSAGYLNQSIQRAGSGTGDEGISTNKALFLYPDLRTAFHPNEPRSYFYFYFGDHFIEYLLRKNLFNSLYTSDGEWREVSQWISDYTGGKFFAPTFINREIRFDVLKALVAQFEKSTATYSPEINLLYLHLANGALAVKDSVAALNYYQKLRPENLPDLLRLNEYDGNVNHYVFRQIAKAVMHLYESGNRQKSFEIVRVFKNAVNRSSIYAYGARELILEKKESPLIQALIDSSRSELSRTVNLTSEQPNRQVLAEALTLQSPDKNKDEIARLIRNLSQKNWAYQSIAMSFAFRNELYQAKEAIPALISDGDMSSFIWMILYRYGQTNSIMEPGWKIFSQQHRPQTTDGLVFINENN